MNTKKAKINIVILILLIFSGYAANCSLAQTNPGGSIYCCTYKCVPGKCEKGYFNGGWACIADDFSKAAVQCTQTNDSQTWRNTCVSSLNNRNDDTHNCQKEGDSCTACLVLTSFRLTGLYKGYSCEYPSDKDPYCLKHEALESGNKSGY